MDRLVGDYSRLGDVVLDSHMGAGTTGVSCARLGRRVDGCAVILKRIGPVMAIYATPCDDMGAHV